jgi:hypothetical protein
MHHVGFIILILLTDIITFDYSAHTAHKYHLSYMIVPHFIYLYNELEFKKKAIPLQALTSPEGSKRLRLTDFKTIGT